MCRERKRHSRAQMELRGIKEVKITSRRRRLKSRDQHLFLLSSLCVPTICAHVRLPDTGHRQRSQRFSADRQKREEKRERKGRKKEKR